MSARYLRNTDPRFHWIEMRSRWFLLLGVIAILGLVAAAMWRLEWFRPVQRLDLVTSSGEGIQRGMPVKLSGFRIGKVAAVDLEKADTVRVRIDLFKEYAGLIRKDAQAVVSAGGSLIGDRFISMTPGTSEAAPVADGDSIVLNEEKSISKMVETIRDEMRPVLVDVREIVSYLNNPEGDFKTTIARIRSVSTSLDTGIPGLLADTRESVNHFDELVVSLKDPDKPLQKSLVEVEATTRQVNQDLPALMRKLDDAAGRLDVAVEDARRVLHNIDGGVGEVRGVVRENAPVVPKLLNEGRATVRDAGDVARSVKNMWPVKEGVPDNKEKTLHAESED